MKRTITWPALLVAFSAIVLALFILEALCQGVEIVPATDGPVPPWKMLRLDIEGATPEQLKTAAVHVWPRDTAEVQAGYGWDGKPYLIFQGTRAGSYWVALCAPVDGGLESAEITVEVGGAGPQPQPNPGPGPSPPPSPDPDPPLDWREALSTWVAEEAAKAMPGRGDEAKKWAGAIRQTAQDAVAGKITDWGVFRVTLKDRSYTALGFEKANEWNDKFDDPLVTPRIEREMKVHGITTVAEAAAMWLAVAAGLERLAPAKSSRAERLPVELICFGAAWCQPCLKMAPVRDALRKAGWRVYHVDVDAMAESAWTRWHRANATAVPHFLVLVDGEPWQHATGARSSGYLVDWLRRGENEWRTRHGQEPVRFEAHGETTLTDPIDREFFYREHWQMTPGDCQMAGCTVHPGKWERVLVPSN